MVRSTLSTAPFFKVVYMIFSIIFLPITILFRTKDNGRYEKIEARIPMCLKCKKQNKKIEPAKVDFEENHMVFKVHPRLAEEFNKSSKYVSYRK